MEVGLYCIYQIVLTKSRGHVARERKKHVKGLKQQLFSARNPETVGGNPPKKNSLILKKLIT